MSVNIAVTSRSAVNPFAGALISRLTGAGYKPKLVICTEGSRLATLRQSVRRRGLVETVRLIRSHVSQGSPNRHLRNYAEEHGLGGWNSPLTTLAGKHGIDVSTGLGLNDPETVTRVQERSIDLILNAGGGIYRRAIIEATGVGVLNPHMGYLPTFRGMNVLEWSLFAGEPIGVTVHFIDVGIDTGDILAFRTIPIEPEDTIESLRQKSVVLNIELLLETIRHVESDTLERRGQKPREGKQFFVMHPRLKKVLAARLDKNR